MSLRTFVSPSPARRWGRAPRTASTRITWSRGVAVGAALLGVVTLLAAMSGADPPVRRALGLSGALSVPLAHTASIDIAAPTLVFTPRATVVPCGSWLTFTNSLSTTVQLRTAPLSPSSFSLVLRAHTQGAVQVSRPGLYHYYDAATAHPLHVVAGNVVIVASSAGSGVPRQGWVAVLCALPPLQQQLAIPQDHDLFAPKVLVAVAGTTIAITNRDADTHNVVVDPASPTGGAFVVPGTKDEPPNGWQQSLVVQDAGLYHVYCSFHTRVVGVRAGWQVVVPRLSSAEPMPGPDYRDHNPMEAWIIVLPATATTS